jgi:ADP-ribose pyrophosphatase YjhB (NUDIX family)
MRGLVDDRKSIRRRYALSFIRIYIHTSLNSLLTVIKIALKYDFAFHHASKEEGVVMTKWIAKDRENKFPEYVHHQIGVGGFVLNKRNEVLCVQERTGPTASFSDFWKLPGGLVDANEDIADAVVREVLEETNIRVKFKSLATMRETHRGPFKGTTDLYFVAACILENPDDDIPVPRPQDSEIANAKWIPLEQFLGSRFYRKGLYGDMLRIAAKTAMAATNDKSPPEKLFRGFGLSRQRLPAIAGKIESLYAFHPFHHPKLSKL